MLDLPRGLLARIVLMLSVIQETVVVDSVYRIHDLPLSGSSCRSLPPILRSRILPLLKREVLGILQVLSEIILSTVDVVILLFLLNHDVLF